MINVTGAYVFDLEVGPFKDFIESRDLVEFTLIEEAGNTIPSFDLKFRFSIPELRNYLIENNVIKVTIGSSDEDKVSIPLRIFKKNLQNYGQNRYYAEISGFYDALDYMRGTHTTSVSNSGSPISGLDAIKNVASQFFTFDTNIEDDSSLQKWLCCRKSYREFLTDIWYRLGLPNKAVPLMTVTKDGVFRLYDSGKLIKGKPKYRLSNRQATEPNDIQINGKPEIINDAGVVSSMVQNKINRIYDMVNGGFKEIKFSQSPIMSTTSDIDSFNNERKDGYDYLLNDNVFLGYWDNYLHNISSLINLSTARLTMSFINKYIDDFHVLDLVEYLEGTESNLHIAEGLYSGRYIVSKIVRTIGENKNFQTHVVLSRESFNELIDLTREIGNVALDIQEDSKYTQAINKLNDVQNIIKSLLALKGMKINLPNIRLLAQELNDLKSTLFGFDEDGIWVKVEHILSSIKENIVFDMLTTIFQFLEIRKETVSLQDDDPIVSNLQSGTFDSYIDMGYLNIPNVGATSLDAQSYTANSFGWYVQGLIGDNIETGDANLNAQMRTTADYIKNGAVVNQQDSAVFRRFWGSSISDNLNENELKDLYSDESVRRYLHKIFVSKGYMYLAYPVYMNILDYVYIDGVAYKVYQQNEQVTTNNSFKVTYKKIKLDGVYVDYLIYKSTDKFNRRATVEIL